MPKQALGAPSSGSSFSIDRGQSFRLFALLSEPESKLVNTDARQPVRCGANISCCFHFQLKLITQDDDYIQTTMIPFAWPENCLAVFVVSVCVQVTQGAMQMHTRPPDSTCQLG